ncbi:MAG: hypothetical protein ACRDE7_01550 [Sphingobacterium sp.]
MSILKLTILMYQALLFALGHPWVLPMLVVLGWQGWRRGQGLVRVVQGALWALVKRTVVGFMLASPFLDSAVQEFFAMPQWMDAEWGYALRYAGSVVGWGTLLVLAVETLYTLLVTSMGSTVQWEPVNNIYSVEAKALKGILDDLRENMCVLADRVGRCEDEITSNKVVINNRETHWLSARLERLTMLEHPRLTKEAVVSIDIKDKKAIKRKHVSVGTGMEGPQQAIMMEKNPYVKRDICREALSISPTTNRALPTTSTRGDIISHNNQGTLSTLGDQLELLTSGLARLQHTILDKLDKTLPYHEQQSHPTHTAPTRQLATTSAVHWADILSESGSDDNSTSYMAEFPTIQESLVYLVFVDDKKNKKRVKRPHANPEITELKEELWRRQEKDREDRKRKSVLTDEEQRLTREQLQQKWAQEAREKRFGAGTDRPLTPEEAKMSKSALRKLWAEEAHQVWLERQRNLGYTMVQCGLCGRFKREGDTDHWCLRTGVKTGKTSAGHQELVVSGSPSTLKVSKQAIVDVEEINKQLEKWNKMREQALQQQGRLQTKDLTATSVRTDEEMREHERERIAKRPFSVAQPQSGAR